MRVVWIMISICVLVLGGCGQFTDDVVDPLNENGSDQKTETVTKDEQVATGNTGIQEEGVDSESGVDDSVEETDSDLANDATSGNETAKIDDAELSIISYISDQSHDEDFNDVVIDLSTVFNKEFGRLDMQVTPIALGAADDIVMTIVTGNTLILRSIDHLWGIQSIEISATDGTVTVTDNIQVTIAPIQDIPIANPVTITTQFATGNIYISSFGFVDYDDPEALGRDAESLSSYEDQASTIEKIMIVNDLHSGNTSAIKDMDWNNINPNQVIDISELSAPILYYEFESGVSANVVLSYKVNDGQDYSEEYELILEYIPEDETQEIAN